MFGNGVTRITIKKAKDGLSENFHASNIINIDELWSSHASVINSIVFFFNFLINTTLFTKWSYIIVLKSLRTYMWHTDAMCTIWQWYLQEFVGDDGTCIGKTKQTMISENSLKQINPFIIAPRPLTLSTDFQSQQTSNGHGFMCKRRKCRVAMDDLYTFAQ